MLRSEWTLVKVLVNPSACWLLKGHYMKTQEDSLHCKPTWQLFSLLIYDLLYEMLENRDKCPR